MNVFKILIYVCSDYLSNPGNIKASVDHFDARPTGNQEVADLIPLRVGNILSWRFDHEIFSTVILYHQLIHEGQFSISGERMCTILVNRLED